MQLRRASCYLLATVALNISAFLDSVIAQISSDGTLSTTVSTDDAVNFLIQNGDRSGNNLFHSFSEFSIPNLGEAYFNNATDITNIFSRVTGGNISDIQGLIRANGTANLFLINPAGIVFGENASLDVGGSFFASTAQSVVFGNGIEFSAVEPQEAPLLTVNITPGLQMGANPGDIVVQGVGNELPRGFVAEAGNSPTGLRVPSGNTIGLLGGEVNLEGGILTAPAGRIEIGAVNSGIVNLNPNPQSWELNYNEVEGFGDIQMSQQALADSSGNGGGNIKVQGANISLESGANIFSQNQGNQTPGVIKVDATEALTLTVETLDISNIVSIWSQSASSGSSADIKITTPRLEMIGGSRVRTETYNTGNAGNITINAANSVYADTISFNSNFITSINWASGNAGNITVSTTNLSLLNGSLLSSTTFGDGDAGDVIVNASESIENIGVREASGLVSGIGSSSFTNGSAGNTTVNTAQLTLIDGGQIDSTATLGGNGGTVTVNATESILIQGRAVGDNFDRPSNISAAVFPPNRIDTIARTILTESQTGNSGSLIINTPSLTVTDEAEITVQNFGSGNAGNLQIQTDSFTLNNQGLISAISNSGEGSSIILQVQDSIVADNNSSISADILDDGAGGDIEITTNNLQFNSGANISTSTTGAGNGGIINITGNNLAFDGELTGVFSEDGEGATGDAGNISLTADLLSVTNNAQISTNSEGLGQAGNINIFFDSLETNQGLITATSGQSGGGNITLTALGSEIILQDNSLISTSVFDSTGGGGDININTDLLVALENSDIRANAVFGQGGNIIINAQGLFLSPDSQITASSEFGVDGIVTLNTPQEDNSAAILELPTTFTDPSQQIAQGCAWTTTSSFYVTGRGGIPQDPSAIIPVNDILSDVRTSPNPPSSVVTENSSENQSTIIEANTWIINEKGNVELVAIVTPQDPLYNSLQASCAGK